MAHLSRRESKSGNVSWFVTYRDAQGRQVKKKGGATQAIAREVARKLEDDVAREKNGLVDKHADELREHTARPIEEHIEVFERHLQARGNTPHYIGCALSRVRSVALACSWHTLADITHESLDQHRADLTARGRSIATINHTCRSCKMFTRQMLLRRRMIWDPLARVTMDNMAKDRRLVRRALSDDELARLFKAAAENDDVLTIKTCRSRPLRPGATEKTRKALTRVDRQRFTIERRDLVYKIACGTGLRLAEIRSLTPSSFDWDSQPATVRVEATDSKRRRTDFQPLRKDLAAELRPFVEQFPALTRIWGNLPETMAAVVRADCEAAGIETVTDDGRKFDFHALRHCFGTRLARGGVPLRTAQELMRHSDPKLTANIYQHLGLRDSAGALESLPVIEETKADSETG